MLMIHPNPQWILEQLLCVFISIVISTYTGNAYDVPSKDLNQLPWDTVLNAPTTDDKIVRLCDHHQKNYKSHANIRNEENNVKYIESNGDEITYHNSDENEIEKSRLLHNNFILDDILTCNRNVTVLYLAGYDDEIFELRNDLLKKGNGNELLIYFFMYSDHKFFNIGKIHTNIIFFDESVLKYSHYYYLNSETVRNICCYNKLRFENLIESVPDEVIDENKSKYFTVYPQKGSDRYEFIIPKAKDMFIKDIIVDLNKNKDNKLNKPAGSTSISASSILNQPNDNEVYYVNEDFLNSCIQSKYLKQKNEKKSMNKNQILKSYIQISPPIELVSKLEDILDEHSKSILHNTKKVLVPCNDEKLEQNIENFPTFIPVTSTVINSKPKDTEKTRVAKMFKDKNIKTFQQHKDTTYYRLPKMLDSYTKTRIDQVYSYKNPFSDIDVNGFNIVAPTLFQGNNIDKISNNNNNRVLPNDSQYYSHEKTPNNINKKLPTEVVSKNTDFNFHTQKKNIPFNRFKPLSFFTDGSYKINYDLNPNYVTYEQNLKPLKNNKYGPKSAFVDFSRPIITSSSNIKINNKHKKNAYLPEAYSLYRLNSATQKQKDEPNKTLIHTPSILNIPCQKLTNYKSRILNADYLNILNTPTELGASLINTNAKLSASPRAHDYIFYSSKYNTNDENKQEEIKRYPYYSKYNELLPASYLPKLFTTNRNFSPDLYQPIPTKIYQPLENILDSSNAPMNGNPNRIQKGKSDFLLFKEKPIISGNLSEKGRLISFLIKKNLKEPDTLTLPLQPNIELVKRKPQNNVLPSSEQEGAQATDDDIEKKYSMNTQSPLNVVICKHKNAIPNSNINLNLTENLNFIKRVNIPKLSTLKQESYENASWFKKYQQNIWKLLPYTKLSYLPKIKSSTKISFQNSYTPSGPPPLIYSSEVPKSPHISMSVTPETIHIYQKPVNIIEIPSSIDLSIPSKNIQRTQFVSIPKFNFTSNQYLSKYHLSSEPQTKTVSAFSIKSPAIPLSQFLSPLSPCQLTHNKPKSPDISLISSYLRLYNPIEPDVMSGTIFKLPQHVLKSNTHTLNQESATSNVFNNKNLSSLTNLSQQWFLPQSILTSPITSQIVAMPERNKILYRPKQNFKENPLKSNLLSKPQVCTAKANSSIISIPKVSSPPLSLYEAILNKLTIEEISPIPSYKKIFKVNKPDVSSNTIFSLPQEQLKSSMPSWNQESPTTKDTVYVKNFKLHTIPYVIKLKPLKYRNWPQNNITLPITSPYMVVPERNLALHLAKQNLDQSPLKPYLSAKPQSVPASAFPIILLPTSTRKIKSPSRSPVPGIRYIPQNDLTSQINKYLHLPKKNVNQYPPRSYSIPEAVTKKAFSIKSPITSLPRMSSPPALSLYKAIPNKSTNQEILPISSYMERYKLNDPDIPTNTIFKLYFYMPNFNQGSPTATGTLSNRNLKVQTNPFTAKSSQYQYRNWPHNIIPIVSPYVVLPESIQKLHPPNQNLNFYPLKTYLSPKLQSEPALPFPISSQNTSILAVTSSSKSPVSAIRNWPQNILTSSIASPHLATPERNKHLYISKQNVTQYPSKIYPSFKPQPVFIKSPITLFREGKSSSSPLLLYETAPKNSIIEEILPIIKPSLSSNVIFTLPQQPLKSSMTNYNQESPTTLSNKKFKVQTNLCVTNHVPSQYRDWPQNNIPSPIASPYVVTPARNQNVRLPKKSFNQYPLQPYLSPKLQSLRGSSLPFTQLTQIPAVKSSSLPNKPLVKIILLKHSHKQPYKLNKPIPQSRTKFTLPKQHFKPNLLTKNQEPVLSKNIFNSLQLKPYILKPTIAEPFQINQTQIYLPKYYNSYKPTKIHDSSPETILQNALLPFPSSITSALPMLSLPTSYKLSYPKYKTYKPKEIYSLAKQLSIPYDKFKIFPTNEYKSIPKPKLNTVPSTSPFTPRITKIWSPKSKSYAPLFNTISPSKQFSLRNEQLIPIVFSKPIDKNINSSTIKSSVLLSQPTFKYSLNLNSHRIHLPSLSSFNQYPYQPTSSDFNYLNISTKVDSISPIAISLNNKTYLKPGSITLKFLLPHLLPKKHSQNKITCQLSSSSNSLLEKSLQYQIPTIQDTIFKAKLDNLPLSSIDNTNNKNHFPNYQTLPISNMKAFIPNFKVPNQVIWRQSMPNRIKTHPISDIASYSKFLSPLNTISLPVKSNPHKHTTHPLEIHTSENYIKPHSKSSIKLQPLHSQICNLAPYSYYSSTPLRTRKKYSFHKPLHSQILYIFPYISFPSKMNLKSPTSFIRSDITSKIIRLPLITSSEPSKADLSCILSSTLAHPLETSILPFTPLTPPLSEMNPNQFRLANDLISHHRHYEPLQTSDTKSSILHSNLPNYSIIQTKYKNILKSFNKYQNYLTYLNENQIIPKKEFKNSLLSPSPIFNSHLNSNLDIESSTSYTNLPNHYTWSQTTPKFTYKDHNNLPLILQDQVNFNKNVKDKATNKNLPLQPNSSFIPFKSHLSYIKPFIKTPSNYQTVLQGTSAPIITPTYQSIYVKNGPSSQFRTRNILSIPSKWIELITHQAPAVGPFKSDLLYLSLPLLKSSSILTSYLHHPVYKTLETLIPPPNLIKKSTWPLNKPKFAPKSVDKYQNYQIFNLLDRAMLSRSNINIQPFLAPITKVASKSKSFNKFKLYPSFNPLNIQAFKSPFSISNVDTTHKNILLQPQSIQPDLSYLKPSERSPIQDCYQTTSPYQLARPETISIQTSKLPTNWQLKKSLTLGMNIIKPNLAYSSPTILSSAKESYHKNADFLKDKASAFERSSTYPLLSNLKVKSGTYSIYKGGTNKIKYFTNNTEIPNQIVNYIDSGKYSQINYLQNKPKIKNQLYSNILYNKNNYKTYYPMISSVKHQTQILSPLVNLNTYRHELITDREGNLKIPIAKILEKSSRPDLGLREIITNNEINENIPYIRAQGTKQIGKEIPLPNISILKYDPREINNGVEIETDNPDIFIKAWTSGIEIIKPRIVYDTFHVQAFNFEPIVKEVGKYDPNVVEDVVKSYVEKYYGEPIVLKGTYNFYKPYIISNVNNEYLKHGKIYLLWPTLCDCGCKCFGCRCHRKFL